MMNLVDEPRLQLANEPGLQTNPSRRNNSLKLKSKKTDLRVNVIPPKKPSVAIKGVVTDEYKRTIQELYSEPVDIFHGTSLGNYVENYITIRVNYSYGFYKRGVQPRDIDTLIQTKITGLTQYFNYMFCNIIYILHGKSMLSLPESRQRILQIWNVIMENIYYIFNPIEKMDIDKSYLILDLIYDTLEEIFLNRINNKDRWLDLYYSLRQYTPWQQVLPIIRIGYTPTIVEERIQQYLQGSMDYVYVYLTTIPASLILMIFNTLGFGRGNNYNQITMANLQYIQRRLNGLHLTEYTDYINRISELPQDVSLVNLLTASNEYKEMCDLKSYTEHHRREPLMPIYYTEYSDWTEENFKQSESNSAYALYITGETNKYGDDFPITEDLGALHDQDETDDADIRIHFQGMDDARILEELARREPTQQLGGASNSETDVMNLIKYMRKIIITPCGPEGGPIGDMEVKSILSDDPIWIEEELFQGKKIVLDWIGIVMAYIVFKANTVLDASGQPIDGDFISTIVFENSHDYRVATGAEILTMEQCKREDNYDKGFCIQNATFSAFMPLIMLSLTLNHSEKFLNKKVRESYVILRTTRRNVASENQSKVISVYNNKSDAVSAHNITPEMFANTISTIYATSDPEFQACIITFLGLRQRMISLLTENNISILSDSILPITLGSQFNIRCLNRDYRMILYNPSRETDDYRKIYNTYDHIVDYIKNPVSGLISQGDFESLYKTVMFQPSLRSASNNKMPTDNWNELYKGIVIQAYEDYINSSTHTVIGSRTGANVGASNDANDGDDVSMGIHVKTFNEAHNGIITRLSQGLPQTQQYTIQFSDATNSFGFQTTGDLSIMPDLTAFLADYAVDVTYNGTFTNISQPANGQGQNYRKFCSFPRGSLVQYYLYLLFPLDMCHDACNETRTSGQTSNNISNVANTAIRQIYPEGNVTYELLKSKGNKEGSSYEKECAKFGFMDEKQYANAVNNSPGEQITSGNVGLTIEESQNLSDNDIAFNFSNAVWTTKENAGNASTFIDGGTKKKLQYLNFPNVCICMNDSPHTDNVNKFYVIVSYDLKYFGEVRNLTMNVSLYYLTLNHTDPTHNKHIFVNHEFILGKGISCHDIYEDIFRVNGVNNRPPGPINGLNLVDPAVPVLLYLKKTLCDWLQNFLKIQYHTRQYHRLGLFVKMRDMETLNLIRVGTEPTVLPLLFSDYNRPIIVNSIPGPGGEQSLVQVNGELYPIYNVFNYISIYWNHYRPTYSPKNFRYFNVSCNPRVAGSSICFTNDILDFCFSVSLTFLVLIAIPPANNPCPLQHVQVNLTQAIGVMAGGSSHNNHKRKRQISYSNTKRRAKKNTKRRVSKRRMKQNKMKSKLTKKYRNKY